jgi:predicted phosphodiesterase
MGGAPARLNRLGVLGDIHAEDESLAYALAFLSEQRLDATVCVGDLVDGPGDADRVCALLQDARIPTIRGNHDRWFLEGERRQRTDATQDLSSRSRAYLESLPATLRFDTAAGGLVVCHAVGDDDMAELRSHTAGYALQDIPTLRELMVDPSIAIMVGGHTHERMVRAFPGLVVVNVGTLLRIHDPCVAILDFGARMVAFHELDIARRPRREALIEPLPHPLPLQR